MIGHRKIIPARRKTNLGSHSHKVRKSLTKSGQWLMIWGAIPEYGTIVIK